VKGLSQLLPAILYDPVFLIAIAVFFFVMVYFYWLKRREKEKEIEARLKRLEEMQKKEANQNSES
jgi:preprotein translocase subunit YajC